MRFRILRALLVLSASLLGVLALAWPLIATKQSGLEFQASAGTYLTAFLLPIVIAVLVNDLISTDFTARKFAVLAGVIAVAVALRMVSPGVAGLEPIWLILLIAGRALGPTSGFVAGAMSIVASALATGGVGPWLPYQMMLAGWIALGAGALPRITERIEIWVLAGYGAVTGVLFGWAMNLWFWPTARGLQPMLALDLNDSTLGRLAALARFSITTSLGFDVPRAILTASLVIIAGPRLLRSIRRVSVTPTGA